MVAGKDYHSNEGQLEFLRSLDRQAVEDPNAVPVRQLGPETKPGTNQMSLYSLPKMLLILDTETTGLDPQIDLCIEVGAILFHVPSRSVLAQQSFLMPVLANAAEHINRIPAEVSRLDQPWQQGLSYLTNLIDASDVLVAHNAAFDRQWFGISHLPEVTKQWVCTMDDFCWPATRQLRARPSVRDIALAYGTCRWSRP